MFDKTAFLVLSDLMINLAAGWLGAAFITPNFSRKAKKEKIFILTTNLALGIFCVVVAIVIRKLL